MIPARRLHPPQLVELTGKAAGRANHDIIRTGSSVDRTEDLSSKLHGTQRVDLVVQGPVEEVQERLRQIKGVWRVDVEGSGDRRRYTIECSPGKEVQDELAEAIVQGGWRLFELKATELSLEDIFLRLTTEEKG